jgi:hypothetical protein
MARPARNVEPALAGLRPERLDDSRVDVADRRRALFELARRPSTTAVWTSPIDGAHSSNLPADQAAA